MGGRPGGLWVYAFTAAVQWRTHRGEVHLDVRTNFALDEAQAAQNLRFLLGAGPFEGWPEAASFVAHLLLWGAPAAAELHLVMRGREAQALRWTRAMCRYGLEIKSWGTVDVLAESPQLGLYRLNVAPGQGIAEHVHRHMREVERVLDAGLWGWQLDEAPRPLRVGEIFEWPADHAHGYVNPSARTATILCIDRPRFDPEDEVETGRPLRWPSDL